MRIRSRIPAGEILRGAARVSLTNVCWCPRLPAQRVLGADSGP